MGFSADFEVVSKRLEQTDEFIRILHGDTEFPASYFFDVRYSLKRIRPEGTWLDERELFDLKRSLQTINDIVRFFKPMDDEEIKYPALTELAGDIFVFPQLIGKIDSILDKFGKVKDSASPELYTVRRSIREREGQISRRLQQIMSQAQAAGLVDADASVSIREGRAVIPVSAANKRKIKGFVHDEAATGKTVYIEPVEVVEINNELKELQAREEREIERILRQLSAEGVIDTIRAERGCLRYDYYLSVQDADELLLVEQWATRADQQVHMGQSHMQTLLRIKEENVESSHVSEITL